MARPSSIVAGTLGAVALGAGLFVAGGKWASRTQAAPITAATPAHAQAASSNPPSPAALPPKADASVVINGRALSPERLAWLRQYGAVYPGRYWYDPVSGLWGAEGHEPAGYVQPGLDFGPLSAKASAGNTGVFVNGREISRLELAFYERVFQTPSTGPGRFWLDGATGNVGVEGNPMPMDNLIRRIQQARGGSKAFSGGSMVGITDGSCTMVTTDTGYNASTSGC